ncbi:MAG: T9SS type A sorting domain-containing protein [Saprospiraceae bacterium]
MTDANACETEDCYDIGSGIFRISPVHIVCLGSSKVLTVRPPRGADFSWSPATGLSCTDCPNPIASPRQSTEYTLTAVLDNGRTETIRILVIVIPPPFCPTAKQINDLELVLEDQLKDSQLEYDLAAIEKEVMKNQNLEADIVIYPNPTSGLVSIQSEEVIQKVEVSDILGKTVLKQSFENRNPQLDLHYLASGLYLLKVTTLKGNSAFWIRKE